MVDGSEAAAPPATAGGGALFDEATELGRDLAVVDWAATGVGPTDQWPAALWNALQLIIGSRFAMWMAWGPELTFFCNDAYRHDTLGAKYPWALGKPAREVWSEIWPDIGPRIDSVMTTGVATWDEALLLFLERSGYVEETYHTFSYSPLRGDDGRIAGMLCVVSEETGRVISERRIAVLRDLGAALAAAATDDEVATAAQRQAASDPYDLPFALVYRYDAADGSAGSDNSGSDNAGSDDAGPADANPNGANPKPAHPSGYANARLQWTSGIDFGGPTAPAVVTAADTEALWHPALFAARGEPHLDDLSAVAGLPTGAWPDPPAQSLAMPLRRLGERQPYGTLIVGLNPYRTLDTDHYGFVELVANQLAAAIARARAFEQERSRVEQLAELDRAKTAFFTNVSHELRTPLTLLLGPAEDALSDVDAPLPERQRQRVEVVQRNAERLLKLVNMLLDFSRFESGQVRPNFEQLDLSRYTAELASMFESAFERAGLHLTIECEPLPSRPYVDREMWANIVLNLLSNALKATFTGGATVRLCEQVDGSGAELVVADTGVGIPPRELHRLFERFHRVSGAELRTHEGSGIGLALVAELARVHGGDATVTSELGAGSAFTVRVPYGRAHLPEEQVREEVTDELPDVQRYGAGYLAETLRWLAPAHRDEVAHPFATDRPSVLVVDDNADMREYVLDLLGDDYQLDSAPDGASALERIRTALAEGALPDLVLTDVMMPRLDGFGLLAALRASPDTAHIPVVMLSARSGEDATIEGLEAGADDYLIKPFSARELLARVRANLELDRARRIAEEMRRARELLDQAEALARIGSWEIDLHTGAIRGSAEWHRIVGVPPESLDQGGLDALVETAHTDDRDALRAAFDSAVRSRTPVEIEVRCLRPDGTEYLAIVRAVAVPGDDGTPRFLRGSRQDITAQRAAEAALAAAQADREAAAREHAIASELQRSLLPAHTFNADQLDVAGFYEAGVVGTEVGGDWHDVIDLGGGRTALVIGDVMGRGVRAAAVMGQLRAAVRAYARIDVPPGELLRLLDHTVRDIDADMIVTCVYAVYDPFDRTLSYANAGHLPPLITVPGDPVRRLHVGAPPLGAGRHGDVTETVELPPGATLLLYTDGLVERRGSDIEVGIAGLAELAGSLSDPQAVSIDDVPVRLVAALLPDGPDDDVAVLACRATAPPAAQRSVTHRVQAGDHALALARRFVQTTLQQWRLGDLVEFDVQLAISELITNALRHGAPPVVLRLRARRDALLIEVHDAGPGAPRPRSASPRDANGRGLLIVAAVATRWGTRLTADGKLVWCEFALPDRGPRLRPVG
jgi:PAS domain S-box-containing protein